MFPQSFALNVPKRLVLDIFLGRTYINFKVHLFTIEKENCTNESLFDRWLFFLDRMDFAISQTKIRKEFLIAMIKMLMTSWNGQIECFHLTTAEESEETGRRHVQKNEKIICKRFKGEWSWIGLSIGQSEKENELRRRERGRRKRTGEEEEEEKKRWRDRCQR